MDIVFSIRDKSFFDGLPLLIFRSFWDMYNEQELILERKIQIN